MSSERFSRRQFLRTSALTMTGAALAACAPSAPVKETVVVTEQGEKVVETVVVTTAPEPTPEPLVEGATIVLMYPDGEFPQEYRDQVTEQFGISLEFLQEDLNRLNAMWAAGAPPDIWRANAIEIGPFVLREQVLSLSPYVDVSSVIKWDDMQPCYKAHMFEGSNVGRGELYGLPKDWGTSFLIYCYTEAFEEAGVPLPSDEVPITYAELFETARKLTKREGDRTLRWGAESHYWDQKGPQASFLLDVLPQIDGSQPLYSESMEKVNLTQNPGVMEVFQAWFNAAKEFTVPSPIDPMPTWFGEAFTAGQLAMTQSGYWYGAATVESEITRDKVLVLPAPIWSTQDKRRDSCVWATASVASSKTKYPEATWKVIEYYSGGQPAIDRARDGWGVPLLKSMFELLPQDTAYNQQRYKVLAMELEYAENALTFNPFCRDLLEAVSATQLALEGETTLEEALATMEKATNSAIQDDIDRLMG